MTPSSAAKPPAPEVQKRTTAREAYSFALPLAAARLRGPRHRDGPFAWKALSY
jgi:hypothetical protein